MYIVYRYNCRRYICKSFFSSLGWPWSLVLALSDLSLSPSLPTSHLSYISPLPSYICETPKSNFIDQNYCYYFAFLWFYLNHHVCSLWAALTVHWQYFVRSNNHYHLKFFFLFEIITQGIRYLWIFFKEYMC